VTVDKFLDELEQVRKTARGWMALCPAHEDSSRSLSIAEGDDGRVLLNCFAGCTTNRICAALGLRIADLFGETDPYANSWQPKTREERQAAENRRLRRNILAVELEQRRTLRALSHAVLVLAAILEEDDAVVLDRVWNVALEELDREAADAAAAYALEEAKR